MKRTTKAVLLILAILFTVLAGAPEPVTCTQYDGYKPPIITVLSPSANATYTTSNIPLNVTVQIFGFLFHNMEHIKWLNYSLDGQTPIPMVLIIPSEYPPGYYVYANDFLTDLSEGVHNLTIYGETALVRLEQINKTITFNVDRTATPIAEPFPTLPTMVVFVAVVFLVAAVSVGLLVYFKKRHPKSGAKT